MAAPSSRLVYLDWLRGLAVLIMVLAHVVDSWTMESHRHDGAFYSAVFVGGLGAPFFMLLAGVAVVLSGYSRSRAAGDPAAGAAAAMRRGADVFVLGLLFRVQSQLLGWGPLTNLFRVDILNVMGLSMIAAAIGWRVAGRASNARAARIALFASATAAATFVTPLVRSAAWPAILPDPIEAYLRPEGRYAAFSIFPWAGFLLAGAVIGELIEWGRTEGRDTRLQIGLFASGVAGALAAWRASYLPALYPQVSFWTSSPAFFFIRLGIITALVPAGWAHCRYWLKEAPGTSLPTWRRPFVAVTRALELMGRSSLFVYWIHVEMVYGLIAEPIKRTLPFWGAIAATLAMSVWLYVLVLAKNRWLAGVGLPRRGRILAAVLK